MAPPRNATWRAGFSPTLAAWAVRTLARTETFMPMKPAAPERTAPTTKPPAVAASSARARTMASTTPTMAMVVYWRLR